MCKWATRLPTLRSLTRYWRWRHGPSMMKSACTCVSIPRLAECLDVAESFVISTEPFGVQTGKTVKLSKFQGIFGKPVSLIAICWGQNLSFSYACI